MLNKRLLFALALLGCVLAAGQTFVPRAGARGADARVITFSGLRWNVRSGTGGPGPNNWSSSNVSVDSSGYLHLLLNNQAGQWYAAEVTSQKFFGFGKYQFQVIGRVDQLDPNVVLGLFNYPTASIGPDGTNEIDIEFSHWGNPSYPVGNYTVWPALVGFAPRSHTFSFALTKPNTTQRFTWTSKKIVFQSLRGFTDGNTRQYAAWAYQPASNLRYIPQHPMQVHFNLWLFQGHPPVDGNPVELVIKSFKFTPAP